MIKNAKFKENGVIFIFLLIILLSSIFTNSFLSKTNINHILRQASILGLLAIGESLVIITGGIDLSLGSIVAFSSILYATFMPNSVIMSIFFTLSICSFIGFLNGLIISKIKIIPFMVTYESYLGIPIPFIILLVMTIIISFFINYIRFGRYIYAVGSNEETARLFGINICNIKLLVYSISGFFAGLAGLIFTARLLAGYCDAAEGYEFDAITASIIGGVNLFGGEGKLSNVILGSIIITIISNFMNLNSISPFTQGTIKGLIIIIAVFISLRGKD